MMQVAERAFHQRLGQLLSMANRNGYWPALAALLGDYVGFEWMFVMVFRDEMPPQVLYEGAGNVLGGALFDEYVQASYVLDPFYLFSMGTFVPGLYRLDHVAGERFCETEYYHRYFLHNSVVDEVQFLTKSPRGGVLSLSLGSKQRFTDDQIGLLYLYSSWILPLLHIPVLLCEATSNTRPVEVVDIEARMRRCATPQLTDHELQTAMMLLRGHSTKDIFVKMGMRSQAVKMQDLTLYQRLGVSTEAEMFALLLPDAVE